MIVNLKCGKCKFIYNFEVGLVSLDKKLSLVFENQTICPNCGAKGEDLLSELGQSQMTAWYMGQP
jgi:ribosomal protein S27AE